MIKSVRLKFDKMKGETAKAVLLQIGAEEHWIPKKLCWKFTLNKKLGGHTVIPTFLYERITGLVATEDIAETIIEKHVPAKIEATNTTPDDSLIR
jgi:hypothetical protein